MIMMMVIIIISTSGYEKIRLEKQGKIVLGA
jgi:hypothetical protein